MNRTTFYDLLLYLSPLLFTLLFAPATASEPFQNKQINNTAGIFYHNLGYAKINTDYFTLLSYTNITFMHSKLKFIKVGYENTLILCSKAPDTSPSCHESLKLLRIQIPQIESKFETITHLVGHDVSSLKRTRRGLFNGVSYAFNWLFGTPDAADAKFYSDSIKKLSQQNHDIQLLMKQQVQIISDAIDNYNSSAYSMRTNEEKLNNNIEKFNNFSLETNLRLGNVEMKQIIIKHINLIVQVITEVNEQCDILISTILFAKQNIIHPSIISPVNLRQELLKVKLRNNVEFPIPINNLNNIYKYFSICDLTVIFDNENLIYAIKIPLVHEQLYNLYHLIPLPVVYQNTNVYSYIDPSYPVLLLSTTKAQYGRLRDLSPCKKLSEEDYLCQSIPIHRTSERPVCETILRINPPENLPDDCPSPTIKADMEIWHPLSTNTWLYVISKKVAASISCNQLNSDIVDVDLKGVGIFELKPGCKSFTASTVLYATSNRTSNYSNYIPSIDITKDDCCIFNREFLKTKSTPMETLTFKSLNLNELRHSRQKLEQFDKILDRNINNSSFFPTFSWLSASIGIILLISLSIILICCCCNCSWLPVIGRFFPKHPSYCGLPNICITNHNERFELSDRQIARMTLNQLRHLEEEDEQAEQELRLTQPALPPTYERFATTSLHPERRTRKQVTSGRFEI